MCMMSLLSSYYNNYRLSKILQLQAKYYNFEQNIKHNRLGKKNCQKAK